MKHETSEVQRDEKEESGFSPNDSMLDNAVNTLLSYSKSPRKVNETIEG